MAKHPFLGFSRRGLLKGLGGLALGAPLFSALRGQASGAAAERVIFFYFPDGVAGPSASGEPSAWHATGSESNFTLGPSQAPLAAFKNDCVFLNGLSMGGTDAGSHPGGAKKLLTATDYGNGESIDQYLARTAGGASSWHHLLLGAQALYNNASGDKHISYPVAGQSLPPQDDPRRAFSDLFGSYTPGNDTGGGTNPRQRVIDAVKTDLSELRGTLGGIEKDKLDYHVESLEELEGRLSGGSGGSCGDPNIDLSAINDGNLYSAETFPAILKAQMDLMILSMECGITRVGTLQSSTHTSELIMSRFAGTEMYNPNYDMRSHQASHYGDRHDTSHLEYLAYEQQVRWWTSQFAYLLAQLKARPEGDGTMLDHSIVVLCTEVCDGNTHNHDNMPFVVAGGANARIRTGRLLQYNGDRHGNLWISVAKAMGQDISWFGDASSGPLYGLVDG